VGILNSFHSEEYRGTAQGRTEHSHQKLMLPQLSGPNSPSHRQRAEEQYAGVDRTELLVQKGAAKLENLGIAVSVQRIRAEHPAKEQDFGHQEQPHPEFARIVLLLGIIEMVR
jgi:hypothetical protein